MATFVPAAGFSWLTPLYDPLVASLTRETEFKSHLLERAGLRPGLRLLDLGCGTGTLLSLAMQRQDSLRLIGIDADTRILARARSKIGLSTTSSADRTSVNLLAAFTTELPCQDNSFDLVITSLVFHHLLADEKRKTLGEIYRVLAPGGKLLLADYCLASHAIAALRFLPVRLLDGWSRTACNVAGKLPILISNSGLEQVRETLELRTWLGTIRCYEACKPAEFFGRGLRCKLSEVVNLS